MIIPEPSYVCYLPMVLLSGGKSVIINTKSENGFKLTPEELRAAITPRTKLLILPYPSNPTGAVMMRSDIEALYEVLRDARVALVPGTAFGKSGEGYVRASFCYSDNHISEALFRMKKF